MATTVTHTTEMGLSYLPKSFGPVSEKDYETCKIDLRRPTNIKGFPTVIFLHGGGLTFGARFVQNHLKEHPVAVAAAGYRLHPHVKHPTYIQDAAAATAWVFNNIESYGGDPGKIFIVGASAGGYLASMITLDKQYMAAHGIDANRIAGLIPLSGCAATHFTVKAEMGIPADRPLVDEFAPLYHIRKDAPPILCMNGDWKLDMPPRVHENAWFVAAMKQIGHPDIEHVVIENAGHDDSIPAYWPPILKFIERISGDRMTA